MKVELPSFNGNVSIEEYLDWVSKVEKFFDYIGRADDKQVCLVAYREEHLPGGIVFLIKPYLRTKASNMIMEENEKINGRSVLTTRLPVGVVQILPGL